MAQTIQFRCPSCLKLLFKYDKETGKIEYYMSQYAFEADEKNNAKYTVCPKCKTAVEITRTGLVERIIASYPKTVPHSYEEGLNRKREMVKV